MKNLAYFLLIATLSIHAQEPTPQQAQEAFRAAQHPLELTYAEGDPIFDDLMKGKKGDIVIMGRELYKIMGHEGVVTHRYGSLYLDAETYSPEEIKKAKDAALKGYGEGTPFEIILEQYYPGDAKDMAHFETAADIMMPDIVAALNAHKAGDIFSMENGADTYVIVKNGEPFKKKAVQVLYVVYK